MSRAPEIGIHHPGAEPSSAGDDGEVARVVNHVVGQQQVNNRINNRLYIAGFRKVLPLCSSVPTRVARPRRGHDRGRHDRGWRRSGPLEREILIGARSMARSA